jgi:PadR family transcriptional regulator PadR
MHIENTKAQMRKGILEFCILSILNKQDKYATEILDSLKESQMIVVEGTIYPLLTRLKNAALLDYRWEESSSGPPRKYYAITDKGKEVLTELNDSWKALNRAVNKITKSN